MVKINKRLLPVKAHFLFFMGAMGPILPQLSVLGKQIGISPDVMGYITSVLPILYVVAKPLVGFIADYFAKLRKIIFIGLILIMTLSYASFYFVPKMQTTPISVRPNADSVHIVFNNTNIQYCSEEFLKSTTSCTNSTNHWRANCSMINSDTNFIAYFLDEFNKTSISISNAENAARAIINHRSSPKCLLNTNSPLNSISLPIINATCDIFNSDRLNSNCSHDSSSFWLFVIFMCLGTIGFNVTNSISDAICFDVLGESEESKYGAQRVWGTIGFGATALLSGIVVDLWTLDDLKSFTPALVIMLVFSGLDLLSISHLKLPKLSSSESIFKDVWSLVKQPAIGVFLIFATMAGIIDSFIIYFMFWHVEEVAAETGYMSQIKLIEGCVVAAECLAGEVPFFFYSGKIIKKLGYVHVMSMCFFFYAVRLALISWIPNPWYLVGVELFLQGCTYALCYTCIVAYASAVAPPGTSATVQGLMAGVDDGLGYSIGSLIGGLAFKRFGGRRSFLYFSIAAIFTCIAHIIIRPTSRKKQYLPKAGYQVPKEQVAKQQQSQSSAQIEAVAMIKE